MPETDPPADANRSRDGMQTSRLVEPHRLVSAGRRWYLVAWDLRRDSGGHSASIASAPRGSAACASTRGHAVTFPGLLVR